MQTLAIANQKGGVGKTTLAVHLATGLARSGKRVLLVDLDPQANATRWLVERPRGARGAAETVLGEHLYCETTEQKGLWLCPATPALVGLDLALSQEIAGELALRRALARVEERFDHVVVDCPPSLGLSVLNALCASDAVLAPVFGSFLSLVGLSQLEATVERIKERIHVRTHVLGYVLFAADGREGITEETRGVLQKQGKLFKSEVRVSTAAKSLPADRRTAWDPGADARGAQDYPAVLRETVRKLEAKRRGAA